MTAELKKQGMCKIHNARFYNLPPRAINSMAYNRDMFWLALTRDDASIEIWDIQHAPYLQQTIVGSTIASIEAIAWCKNRLFSTGLTGELIEWDLRSQQPKVKLLLTGNAAWCMDINRQNTHLVAGTDSGFLNVYDVSNANEVNFVKVFDKQDGKILCCKFDASGEFVATGSADAIRLWEMKTGRAIYKMSVGRSEAKKETIVWNLQVLKDLVIIAGDSRGYITVWDGRLGAQIDSFQATTCGDVLAVAVNDDETIFACAGVNPKIRFFALTEVKRGDAMIKSWVKFFQRSVHEHDVKTLQFIDGRIFSGGVDGYLGVSNSSKVKGSQMISRYGPFLDSPPAVLAAEKRVVLLKYSNYLEVWRLGVPSTNVQLIDDESERRKYLTLQDNLQKLIEMRAVDDSLIVCATISPNGEFLLYSTNEEVRLFHLKYEGNKVDAINRLKDVPGQFTACRKSVFSSDSQTVFLAKTNLTIDIFRLLISDDLVDIDYEATIDLSKSLKGPLSHLIVSDCGHYLVAADVCCNITVWCQNKRKWSHHINLPKYHVSAVSIAIHKHSPKLVAAFADGKLFEYHLDEMKFLTATTTLFVDNQDRFPIKCIAPDPKNENIFIVHNDTHLFVLKKQSSRSKNTNDTAESKRTRSSSTTADDDEDDIATLTCTSRFNYEHLLNISWLNDTELIAVGVNPITMIAQLPSSLKEKRFGVS